MQPEPFDPDFEPAVLDVLRARLLSARWPEVIGADDWRYGVPQAWLRDMIGYWANEWDWETVRADMARHEHFRVEIDAVPVHFMRVRGTGPDPVPLICTHGWPWTFWDFRYVVDALADPAAHGQPGAPSFDVIVPSLPGFAYSTPLRRPGIAVPDIAERWVALMCDVLGYERFLAHGGDWGSIITAWLGHAHADRLVGAHMTLPTIPSIDRRAVPAATWADDERWMIERAAEAGPLIRSHLAVHTHDPQTLAYAMADSPVGTAAWLWERRRNWSDCDGDVESVFTREHLCTTATLYWATGAFGSSLRIYHEHFGHLPPLAHDRSPIIEAPAAYAFGPKELVFLPRAIAEQHANLHRWTVLDSGGHFTAAERPDAIVADLRAFAAQLTT